MRNAGMQKEQMQNRSAEHESRATDAPRNAPLRPCRPTVQQIVL